MKKRAVFLVAPVACWLISGCGGGGSSNSSGGNTGTGSVTAGQTALSSAIADFEKGDKPTAQTKAFLQQAINQFAGPASRGDSTANAGLATALFAQSAIEISEDPSLNALVGSALPFGEDTNMLGLGGAVGADLKVPKTGLLKSAAAPLKLASLGLSGAKISSQSRARISSRPRVAANEIRNLQDRIANVELPRMRRIADALQKISKSPTFGFVVYTKGTTKYKLYGPDFQMVQGFSEVAVGLFSTLVAYNLDPGTLYQNVDDLSDLDRNNDKRLTPAEYLGSGDFLKLRTNGSANLSSALLFFRRAANTLDAGIQAEKNFNAPSDALVRLTSEQKQELGEVATGVTQLKTALAGNYSFPLNDKNYTVNIPQFFETPLSDFRTALPTVVYRFDSDKDENVPSDLLLPADRSFSGVFPNASENLYQVLLDELENLADEDELGPIILAKR